MYLWNLSKRLKQEVRKKEINVVDSSPHSIKYALLYMHFASKTTATEEVEAIVFQIDDL